MGQRVLSKYPEPAPPATAPARHTGRLGEHSACPRRFVASPNDQSLYCPRAPDRRGAGMNEWVLAEQTHAFVRSQKWQAAVLPFGATEPHNLHMPYGTDNFQVEALARRACRLAYEAGARVALLPTVPFGVNTNYFKVPGSLACSL